MPGFVIHLSVANKYLETNKIEDKEDFYNGVIAPDLTDDKSTTHYGSGSSEVNLREYLEQNEINTSFKKGYFLHLITDYLFYNRYLKAFSKDIYNDYDLLNKYLIDKYHIILPEKVQNQVFFKEGNLKLLDKETIITFIDTVAQIDLLDVEKEIKSDNPKGKWNTYTLKKIILPNYEHSVLNLITSILKRYEVETKHKTLKNIDEILRKGHKNVVLLILDGMGEHILNNISKEGYLNSQKVDCVTSVYPSTTTAAITTYYSGKPPYETGWIGWSQYFKEYGRAIDMLPQTESYKKETLKEARINVFEDIVKYKTVFEMIEEASPNVKAYEIMPTYSEKKAKRSIRADTIDEVIANIEMLCNNQDENFILAYSDNPDGLLHKYGTTSEEVKQFVLETEKKIEEMCSRLSEDTVLIISADHGHKDIEKSYTLLDYPEIQECLILPPSLESRTIAFWVKEDMKKEFEERFNKIFKEEFWLMTKDEFLEKNFLGFGEKHKKIDDFIGNYIALSISSSMIRLETFWAEGKKVKKSTHCGLTKEEMEVPIIVIDKK